MECKAPRYYKISFYIYETKELRHSEYHYLYEMVNHINKRTDIICNNDGSPATFNDIIKIINQNTRFVSNFIKHCVQNGFIYIDNNVYILNPYIHTQSFKTEKSVYKLFDGLPEWQAFLKRMDTYYFDNKLELTLCKRNSRQRTNKLKYEYL